MYYLIKKVLILWILLSITKCNSVKSIPASISCEASVGDELLGVNICIPNEQKSMIEKAPNFPNKTDIIIEMSNVQVVEIDIRKKQIIVRMTLKIEWSEPRLKLWTGIPPNVSVILRNDIEQNRIWSPKIELETDLVSKERKNTKFGVSKNSEENIYSTLAFKHFYLRSTMKCEMKFHKFPFDKHECIIEVSASLCIRTMYISSICMTEEWGLSILELFFLSILLNIWYCHSRKCI